MSDEMELLKRVYDRFNARDMESVLAAMHEDVMWANGMEGGHVHGVDGVRKYWTDQWAMIDPHVEPTEFSISPEGEVVIEVHQVVRDLNGNLLTDKMVGHMFRIENGLIKRFHIRGQ
jgi:ketosteroid isomerase-like protein